MSGQGNMSAPHVIRLRGPWEREAEPPATTPPAGADLADEGASTLKSNRRARYRRRFGRPHRLEAHEAVYLVVRLVQSAGKVAMNERLLGDVRCGTGAARFDITALLEERNQLVIDVESPPPAPAGTSPASRPGERRSECPFGDVRLEILERR